LSLMRRSQKIDSSTTENPSEQPFMSNTEDEEHFIAFSTQLTTWAEKTLQDVSELVSDPVDTRRTRSHFFGAPQAMDDTEPLIPTHFYM
jgi:hypothetical protein